MNSTDEQMNICMLRECFQRQKKKGWSKLLRMVQACSGSWFTHEFSQLRRCSWHQSQSCRFQMLTFVHCMLCLSRCQFWKWMASLTSWRSWSMWKATWATPAPSSTERSHNRCWRMRTSRAATMALDCFKQLLAWSWEKCTSASLPSRHLLLLHRLWRLLTHAFHLFNRIVSFFTMIQDSDQAFCNPSKCSLPWGLIDDAADIEALSGSAM